MPESKQQCELCGLEIRHIPAVGNYGPRRAMLAGLCADCTDKLGGGQYSARIVRQEAEAIKKVKA